MRRIFPLLLCLGLASAEPPPSAPQANSKGEAIYRELCAKCHGANGEGVAGKHDEALYGTRSIQSLTRLIDRTMPDDEPEKCNGEDAAQVAEFIFNAFYSPQARARQHPAKIVLARLTNSQYRNSVADLVGSFRQGEAWSAERGLRGDYFNNREQKDKRFDRVDPKIDFDFGTGSPEPEMIGADAFAISWRGSLWANDTGEYELRLRTPNGARLYLNTAGREEGRGRRGEREAAVIDAWVSSGGEAREHNARIFLLGGRAYPLRLEFFKFNDKTGGLWLEWKPPHKAWAVIPPENLSPIRAARTTVVTAAFPPDDSSVGYERGTSVSKQWDQATTQAAIDVANEVVTQLSALSGCPPDAPDRIEKLKAFCAKFAGRAFRRPLTPEQQQFFVDRHFEGASDPETAVKRIVLLVLKSPRFLYPELGTAKPDAYDVAARLALGLWDSLPDEPLLEVAAQGHLQTAEEVVAQARRMLDDPRAKSKLRGFFSHWLAMDEAADITKDPKTYPDFNEAVLSDLRASLEKFVEDVIWSDASDYRQLLVADYLFVNQRLAKLYGVEPPAGDGFEKVSFKPGERAGIFTHPYLLSAFAYHKATSPIKRGVFLTRNVLGRFLKPPPMAMQFVDERFDPSLTMREKVTELTNQASCMSCHALINPLGFSLENYDAIGRFRSTENNKPVNAESDYTTAEGEVIRLHGARDLAEHASASLDAQIGFVKQLFHHTVKQPPAAYGPETLDRLHAKFAQSQFNVRELLLEIVKTAALHGTQPPSEG